MSTSKAATRRAAFPCLGILTLLAGSAIAQPAVEPFLVGGSVRPVTGTSAPPANLSFELKSAFTTFDERRGLLHGDVPDALFVARVGADGTVLLIAPKPGLYRIEARGNGFRTLTIPLLPLVEATQLPPIEPVSVLPLAVQVLDPSGEPAGGVAVRIVPTAAAEGPTAPGAWRPTAESALTDAQGRTVVYREARAKVAVSAETPGAAAVVDVQPDATWTVVRMTPSPSRTLVVRDAAGRPVTGALVYASGVAIAETGDDGRAEISASEWEKGPLLLLAENGEWAEVPAPRAPGKSPISIRLAPPRKVRGSVLAAGSGQPVSGAVVWASGGTGPGLGTMADSRGNFEILLSESKPPAFGAAAKGYVPKETAPGAAGARNATVALRLEPSAGPQGGAAVSGVVVDIRGIPIPGAELYAVRTAQTRIQGHRPQERFAERLGTTSREGGFLGEGILPGGLDLLARAKGYVPGRVGDLRLGAGQRLYGLRIVLIDGVRLEGKVTGPDGQPIEGAEIEAGKILPPGAPVAEVERPGSSGVTDRDGNFTLLGLETGTYRIWAEGPQGTASGTVEVGKGGGRIELKLEAATASTDSAR